MAQEGYYAVDGDSNGITVEATNERGAIHIHAIEEVAGLETALFEGNYPAKNVLRHVESDDLYERNDLGNDEPPEVGLYAEHLREFIELCCESDWPTTVTKSVSERVVEVSQ